MRILIDNILWHDNINKGLHPWSFVKKKSSLKLLKVCNMGKLAWEINPEVKLKNLLKRSLRLLKQDYHLKKKKIFLSTTCWVQDTNDIITRIKASLTLLLSKSLTIPLGFVFDLASSCYTFNKDFQKPMSCAS